VTRSVSIIAVCSTALLMLLVAGLLLVANRQGPGEQYREAVSQAAQQVPPEVAGELVVFPPGEPLAVDSWIPESQVTDFRTASGQWLDRASEEIWVTVEPRLQKFCTAFFAAHGRNLEQLTLRLEQRLGLPPQGGKWKFLEIRLNHPTLDVIFRPCLDPATDRADCLPPAGGESSLAATDHRSWLHKQYVDAYGKSPQSAYPWTGLGYTFDWAPGAQPGEFQRFGESEFVIRKGAPIQIMGAVDTADYCRAS
jgi:hypothetical protein